VKRQPILPQRCNRVGDAALLRQRTEFAETGQMRALLVLIALAVVVVIGLMSLGMISIGGGALPQVKVEGGAAPKVDVGKINVGTVNKTIEVPTVDVEKAANTTQ
jgi:hypothetical protein